MYAPGISNMFTFGLRHLAQNQEQLQTSLERLATGKRVNRAADDPSAIIPIENHKAEIYSLNKELDALAQQTGFLGAKEGGLSVVSDLMIELESLAVQAANSAGNSDEELRAYQQQADSILAGIDNIARTTTFKGDSVLKEYTTNALSEGLRSFSSLLADDPSKAQEVAKKAAEKVSTTRGAIGNQLKSIDTRQNVIATNLEGLNASLSSIQDTDYAAETAKLVRSQILESATLAAIDISRQSANQVLDLIKQSTQFVPAKS